MSNNNFKAHVTSTAFHLGLSQQMIEALAWRMVCADGGSDHEETQPESHYLTSNDALNRRGLIERTPSFYGWDVTEAGRHVFELCKLAGLVRPYLLRKVREKQAA